MAKYNRAQAKVTRESIVTENLAGGEAFVQTPEMELTSLMLTSFVQDQFYRREGFPQEKYEGDQANKASKALRNSTLEQMRLLLDSVDLEYCAKLAVYTRNEFGMRSISHAMAAELADKISKAPWARKFFNRVVRRVDDITETIAYRKAAGKKPLLTNAMRRGLADAFDKFNVYQLGKYKGDGKAVSLVDAVNLCHPKPVSKNEEGLKALIAGNLKAFDTWEAELSKAGQAEDVDTAKKEVWIELIKSKKLGYFAALRNIRNILEQAPEVTDDLCALLTDERLIKSSLVLPFRFTTAWEALVQSFNSTIGRKVPIALNKAMDISLSNVPDLPGETCVVLDVSGSMMGRPSQIGSLFAAVLAKKNLCDVMVFSDNAAYVRYNPTDSVMSIASGFRFASGGTNFNAIFQAMNRPYDRIIILSDMQGWVGYYAPDMIFAQYRKTFKSNPYVYSWDLAGYGTLMFPQDKIFCLAGFSEKVFDVMALMENGANSLVREITKTVEW